MGILLPILFVDIKRPVVRLKSILRFFEEAEDDEVSSREVSSETVVSPPSDPCEGILNKACKIESN